MKIKILSKRMLAVVMAAAMMATGATASSATTLKAAAAKQTVTVWSWFVQSNMETAIAAFEKTHPNITVQYTYYNYSPQYITALKTASASNTLPDIIGLQPGSLTQQYRTDLVPSTVWLPRRGAPTGSTTCSQSSGSRC